MVVPLPPRADKAAQFLYQELANELGKLPEVKEVVYRSTQRGPEPGRELVELVVRFVKRVQPDEAERLVRRTIKKTRTRWTRVSSPVLRAERRERKRAKREAARLRRQAEALRRLLGNPA